MEKTNVNTGRKNKDRTNLPFVQTVTEITRGLHKWQHRVYPMALIAMLLVLGALVGVLTNPAATSPALPLTEELVGSTATEDIQAPVSFPVTDEEATERKRKEAEESVRSVYDFEQELGSERISRLREAFAEMAKIIEQYEISIKTQKHKEESIRPKSPGLIKNLENSKTNQQKPLPTEQSEPRDPVVSLDTKLENEKGRFIRTLQVVLNDEDFSRLRRDRFSSKSLSAMVGLIADVMQRMIVENHELLAAEQDRGITIRVLREGVPYQEHMVRRLSKILDVKGARSRLERTAALELRQVSPSLRTTYIRVASTLVAANLKFNKSETRSRREQARDGVKPLISFIEKDSNIIDRGEIITPTHIRIFKEMKRRMGDVNPFEIGLGTFLLFILILVITNRFSTSNIRAFFAQPRDYFFIGLVLLIFMVTIKIWFWIFGAVWDRFQFFALESYHYAIPFAAGAMLVRFVLNSEIALAFSAVTAILAGLLMDNNIGFSIYCFLSSLVAAWAVATAKQRISLLKAGSVTGLANMTLAIGVTLFFGNFWSHTTLFNIIFAFFGGIFSAMIVTASAGPVEALFGYTTDVSLLRLASLNHPLLKDLIVQAPGSYHHSIIVGSLVEAAAEAIHCNPLLARVMAYYHDIGKVKSPHYFSENQRDRTNPHDKLKPSLSATVLKKHVKDGAELARTDKLGQPILDAITQHHGTSLIKFFYQKAKDHEDPENPVKEAEFRYPGPKPQSREVALVMLGDSVEAAARSITEPSPARLQGLVQNIINRNFSDGQLNESDLTLKDLHEIARAFTRVLTGIYHHRPDYPEAATKERESIDKKPKDTGQMAIKKEQLEKSEENLKRLGL